MDGLGSLSMRISNTPWHPGAGSEHGSRMFGGLRMPLNVRVRSVLEAGGEGLPDLLDARSAVVLTSLLAGNSGGIRNWLIRAAWARIQLVTMC
jgi:hypothetical protein